MVSGCVAAAKREVTCCLQEDVPKTILSLLLLSPAQAFNLPLAQVNQRVDIECF